VLAVGMVLTWTGSVEPAIAADGAAATATAATGDSAAVAATYDRQIHALLGTYCVACHDAAKHKGDVDLAAVADGAQALTRRPLWRTALAQVTAHDMPPAQAKQPDDGERAALLGWLRAVRRLEPPDPGTTVIRRLARVEYVNTVSDLFATDLRIGDDLPTDSPGAGFDNAVSPLLMEKYLLAADEVLDRIIVPDQMRAQFAAGQMNAISLGHLDEGRADGTAREFAVTGEVDALLAIPVDGTYQVRITAGAQQAGNDAVRLAVRFDDQVVGEVRVLAKAKAPAVYTQNAKLVSGRTRLSVIFANALAQGDLVAAPARPAGQAAPVGTKPGKAVPAAPAARTVTIASVEIVGPPAKPPGEAQRRLFGAAAEAFAGKPGARGDHDSRRAAARRILVPFAERAFRRPPVAEELETLLKVFDLSDGQDEVFSEAVKLMLKAVLVSPQFLYRTPADRGGAAEGAAIVPVDDWELASRLSYFLWSTMPDDELLRLARAGTLHERAVVEQQVRRLLASPRSRAVAETFAAPWLELDRVAMAALDEKKFPGMTRELRQALAEEGVQFFDHLLREGGSMLDLIDCRYAYVNGLTAKWYGVDGVSGPQWRKVALSDADRGGVVTMPGVLMVTSLPTRTSPVKRGKWVLEKLLGSAPPPPPPDVPALGRQDTPANHALTLRQKTERHREDPACAACHRVMDPIGFGLENFDAVGRWRTQDDNGGVIDAVGELPGKLRFSSPAGLKQILLARKDEFARTLTGALLSFALGRELTAYDEVVADALADQAARDGDRLDTVVVGIATSHPFLNRQALH
jgi:cytochrome c553